MRDCCSFTLHNKSTNQPQPLKTPILETTHPGYLKHFQHVSCIISQSPATVQSSSALLLVSFLLSIIAIAVRVQFFNFQFSTFDKSRFPRALIIAWKSHHSPYPLVLLPPLMTYTSRRTWTRTKHSLNLITIFQSCPKTTTTTSVTKIYQR